MANTNVWQIILSFAKHAILLIHGSQLSLVRLIGQWFRLSIFTKSVIMKLFNPPPSTTIHYAHSQSHMQLIGQLQGLYYYRFFTPLYTALITCNCSIHRPQNQWFLSIRGPSPSFHHALLRALSVTYAINWPALRPLLFHQLSLLYPTLYCFSYLARFIQIAIQKSNFDK